MSVKILGNSSVTSAKAIPFKEIYKVADYLNENMYFREIEALFVKEFAENQRLFSITDKKVRDMLASYARIILRGNSKSVKDFRDICVLEGLGGDFLDDIIEHDLSNEIAFWFKSSVEKYLGQLINEVRRAL